jgi:hypothetical protein
LHTCGRTALAAASRLLGQFERLKGLGAAMPGRLCWMGEAGVQGVYLCSAAFWEPVPASCPRLVHNTSSACINAGHGAQGRVPGVQAALSLRFLLVLASLAVLESWNAHDHAE